MLIIPRKVGESIVIGNEIIVTVVKVQEDNVRIGIECPPDNPDDEAEIAEVKKHPR